MANYYKNSTTLTLGNIIAGITDSTICASFQNASSDYTSASFTFKSVIDETPSENLGYLYKGTDIRNNSIAYYTNNGGSKTIPSWCNKIRAVLVGGGGGGQTGIVGSSSTNMISQIDRNYGITAYHQHLSRGSQFDGYLVKYADGTNINSNKLYVNTVDATTALNNTIGKVKLILTTKNQVDIKGLSADSMKKGTPSYVHHQNQHQNSDDQKNYEIITNFSYINQHTVSNSQNTGSSGRGGGGGAFIYLNGITVSSSTSIQVTLGSGGGVGVSGSASSLIVGSTTYTAGGGATSGTGGSVTATNATTNSVGVTTTSTAGGTSGLNTTYISTTSYGNGGAGTIGVGYGETADVASSGISGLARIYYLTG